MLREALAAEAASLRDQNARLQAKYDEASARRDGYSKTDAHHVAAREAMLAELASERRDSSTRTSVYKKIAYVEQVRQRPATWHLTIASHTMPATAAPP